MTIEYVTKEKVQSIHYQIPGLLGKIAIAPETASYILLADEKLFSTTFAVAIVVEKDIFYLSNEDYLPQLEEFLKD